MTKMTKRNMYDALVNFANGGEMSYVAGEETMVVTMEALKIFAEHEIELLDKKAAKAKSTASKKKAEGDALSVAIEGVLTDEFQTIAEITEAVQATGFADVTAAKVSYRLNALAAEGAGKAEKGELTIKGADGKKARKAVAYKAA